VWWENADDTGTTWVKHTIANINHPRSIYAIDLDNDSDNDVLCAASGADKIMWWESDGGNPPSFVGHLIANFEGACSVYATDFDGDNDIDVFGAAEGANAISWWENDGSSPPDFTEHNIATDFSVAQSVFAIDLNDDSNVDVLGAAWEAHTIAWWEKARHDVGPASIDIPSMVPEDTTFQPQATIGNFGNDTETSFLVTCEIEPGGYVRNRTINELPPGDSVQVTFFQEFTFESGMYTVTVYTRLSDDSPANDTLEKIVETYVPGISDNNYGRPSTFLFNAPTLVTGRTTVELMIPEATDIDLVIYDALGRLSEILIAERLAAGDYTISTQFDLPTGIYFYKLKAGTGETLIKKFLIIE
jgi:hypothetical protein